MREYMLCFQKLQVIGLAAIPTLNLTAVFRINNSGKVTAMEERRSEKERGDN